MTGLNDLFEHQVALEGNFIISGTTSSDKNQSQTNEVFSEKWYKVQREDQVQKMEEFQKEWYLKLYGFQDQDELSSFLQSKNTILDAGCGLGYKAAWFAELAPESLVIGMDFSEAAKIAAQKYDHITNLYFVQGDIAETGLISGSVDYVSCDQVIMHTENPEKTFHHLSGLLSEKGEFACYVYAKKALPRELLDDYFRSATHDISTEDLWNMSAQLTELGKRLTELELEIDVPDIPLLGIKGGKYDIQRFIYWNFLKCFYKEDWDKGLNDSTNFDWYSPSNARRFSEKEFRNMARESNLKPSFFHSEEACYSGRFKR
jgi:SAM-dependent methyltransferase